MSLKTSKKYSDKIINKSFEKTTVLYHKSVKEVLDLKGLSQEEFKETLSLLKKSKESPELQKVQEEINEVYLSKMIQMPSSDLSLILDLHEEGLPTRAAKTIETITSELARRELFGDTSEVLKVKNVNSKIKQPS